MRHQVFKNQFGRPTNQTKALFRGLVSQVITYGRVTTSLAKARAVVGLIDQVIILGKKGDDLSKRHLQKILGDVTLWKKLLEVSSGFSKRNSGFSRIIKLGKRYSDTTEMAVLELVEREEVAVVVKDETVEVKLVSKEVKTEKKKDKVVRTMKKPGSPKKKLTKV